MKAFVTGHDGFTGRHLAAHLGERGDTWIGYPGDIRDREALRRALAAARPDVVFHLAGLLKSDDPAELDAINVGGTEGLCDVIVDLGSAPRVVITSSSAVYGASQGRISEATPTLPVTPYGRSKLAQEQVATRYADRLPIVRARAFNLLGPGLPTSLACGAFADRIARIERAGTGALRTGKLSAARDFTDVRDVVRGYVLLAERGTAGEVYNICSERGVTIQSCVDTLLALAKRPIERELDTGLLQTNDIDVQIGDCTRLRTATGWSPAIAVDTSLADMLEYSRQQVNHEGDRPSGR